MTTEENRQCLKAEVSSLHIHSIQAFTQVCHMSLPTAASTSAACGRSTDLVKEVSGGAVRVAECPDPTLVAEGQPCIGPPLSSPPPCHRCCTNINIPGHSMSCTHTMHMHLCYTVQQQQGQTCKHYRNVLKQSGAHRKAGIADMSLAVCMRGGRGLLHKIKS